MRTRRFLSLPILLPFSLLLGVSSFAGSPGPDESVAEEAPIVSEAVDTALPDAPAVDSTIDVPKAEPVVTDTTVRLHIAGVASVDGQIFVSVFDSKKAWLKRPVRQVTAAAAISSTENPLIVELQLPAGEYAIQVFHDTDGNGKMKTNFIGIPKEPTGVSNDAKGKFGPPKFVDAKFTVGDEPLDVPINMVTI